MGAEEFHRGGFAFLFLVIGEALPEIDGFAWVVTSAGHEDAANLIGFEFVSAREFEEAKLSTIANAGG